MKTTLEVARETKVLLAQVKELCEVIQGILTNSSANEIARYSSYAAFARMYQDFVNKAKTLLRIETMLYNLNPDKLSEPSEHSWENQKQVMEQILVSSKFLVASLEGSLEFVHDEFDNLNNFLQTTIRSAIFQEPQKEVEVQNAIETLLLGRGLSKGIDYDRESGKLEFSGKEYIPDFIIPKLSLCIEVKLLRTGQRSKIIEQISADINAYRKCYSHQLYVVYDLGVIQNEAEFKHDIEAIDGVKVIIIKH